MKQLWKRFLVEEEGATATEYAVMLALIVGIAIAALSPLGTKVKDIFSAIDGKMTVPT